MYPGYDNGRGMCFLTSVTLSLVIQETIISCDAIGINIFTHQSFPRVLQMSIFGLRGFSMVKMKSHGLAMGVEVDGDEGNEKH